ncbi:MAG: M48 family metallopeptidase [Thaumarchaeota archaeon]|nr:M48 family metallopeptidase [Nitrososphaerota archaeon]
MPVLEIAGRRIDYVVTRGRSRRYTYFRFRPDMTLEVVLPRGMRVDPSATIRHRAEWILKKYEEMRQTRRILDDKGVMFDGKMLEVIFQESQEREEILPDLEKGVVTVRASERPRIKELVRRWFLKETSRYVVQKLSDMSAFLPQNYRRADVREIKNWGYCTKSGRLSFSWQLIALPERLREYIILHELTHLEEFNHSAAFKRRLSEVCPDYKQREKELDLISPANLKSPF